MRNIGTVTIYAILLIRCSAAIGEETASHQENSARTSHTLVVNNQAANASDNNPATDVLPLRTIQAAANLARAGDTVLVKAGIYREEVVPPRGGDSPQKPITYRAAPGEEVSIRGSEQITTWVDQGDGVWMVELDTVFFKGYNPFAMPVWGAWLHRGRDRRLGDVYCNGEALLQKMKIEDMRSTPNTWYTDLAYGYVNSKDFPKERRYPGGKIKIWANFGGVDPNTNTAEINARATAIFPEKSGLKYIMIDGFDIRHTAPQWGDIYWTEKGAVGPKYGYGWTIQNCTITNSRNIGISLGVTDEVHFPRNNEGGLLEGGSNIPPLEEIGHHLIRNNVIRRCGQTGIYGCYGAVGCVIEGNVISESNYRKEWFGTNQAAIKILFPIDVVIRNNLINGMPGESNNAKGIWLDWGSQNTRVTGNIIRDFGNNRGLFLEVNFGPIIVDNNVIVRSSILVESNGVVLAHNLFEECNFHFMASPKRTVPYYKPHSTVRAGKTAVSLLHNRIYNNLIIGGDGFSHDNLVRKGVDAAGVKANYNVYLDGAGPFPKQDDKSIVDRAKTGLVLEDKNGSWTLKMKLPDAVFGRKHPLVTSKLIGRVPLADMFMEHPDGTPLDLAADFHGRPIVPVNVMPGPFQGIRKGKNRMLLWPKKTSAKAAALAASARGAETPNILFIMSDDHCARAIGAYGLRLAPLNPTPNIDKLAGVETPSYMQGRSFAGALEGEKEPDDWRKGTYYRYWMHMAHGHSNPAHFGIRTKKYKLIFFYGADFTNTHAGREVTKYGGNRYWENTPVAWEFYDLEKDPKEMRNRFKDPAYQETIADLKKELKKIREKLDETDKQYPRIQRIIDDHWDD